MRVSQHANQPKEDGYETDIVPSMKDVYADIDVVRKTAGITQFKAKFVKRKYNFGEPEVPTGESQWLKVVYPFSGESVFILSYHLV